MAEVRGRHRVYFAVTAVTQQRRHLVEESLAASMMQAGANRAEMDAFRRSDEGTAKTITAQLYKQLGPRRQPIYSATLLAFLCLALDTRRDEAPRSPVTPHALEVARLVLSLQPCLEYSLRAFVKGLSTVCGNYVVPASDISASTQHFLYAAMLRFAIILVTDTYDANLRLSGKGITPEYYAWLLQTHNSADVDGVTVRDAPTPNSMRLAGPREPWLYALAEALVGITHTFVARNDSEYVVSLSVVKRLDAEMPVQPGYAEREAEKYAGTRCEHCGALGHAKSDCPSHQPVQDGTGVTYGPPRANPRQGRNRKNGKKRNRKPRS